MSPDVNRARAVGAPGLKRMQQHAEDGLNIPNVLQLASPSLLYEV